MHEARKVVSSPRWQNTVDVTNAGSSETKPERNEDAAAEKTASSDAQETLDLSSNVTAETKPASATETAVSSETLEAAETLATSPEEDAKSEDDTATSSPAYSSRHVDPPSALLKGPLLTLTAVCSVAAAAWSYSALEDVRTQLASVSSAKASLEQSLSEAKAKLAVAEKTVADVKAAISAATAASTKAATPAAK